MKQLREEQLDDAVNFFGNVGNEPSLGISGTKIL
jgi:hypothetical protein